MCQAIRTYKSSPDGFEDKLVEEVRHVHVIIHLEHLLLVKHLHLVQGAVTTATGNVSSLHQMSYSKKILAGQEGLRMYANTK